MQPSVATGFVFRIASCVVSFPHFGMRQCVAWIHKHTKIHTAVLEPNIKHGMVYSRLPRLCAHSKLNIKHDYGSDKPFRICKTTKSYLFYKLHRDENETNLTDYISISFSSIYFSLSFSRCSVSRHFRKYFR